MEKRGRKRTIPEKLTLSGGASGAGSRSNSSSRHQSLVDGLQSETSRDSFTNAVSSSATAAAAATAAAGLDADERSRIGRTYMVRRLNSQWLPGEILETRRAESRGNRLEYFVHFENHDKRLDEWVESERIDFQKGELITNSAAATAKTNVEEEIKENLSERKFTRQQKRKSEMSSTTNNALINELDPEAAELEKEREELTKVKYIEKIHFGRYEIDTWYYSPYPEEYQKSKLFLCEYCLKYMKLESSYKYHLAECTLRSPPGKEIYHNDSLSVFEVDGIENKLYCQCLTLLAKLFLDHKTLYYDVSPFVFYVLTEVDKNGCHLVGYFSKEVDSTEGNNLACILTLPPYQRKGYGKFLIAFSYLLTRMEGTSGSPEKPLSDLGKLSYRSFWSYSLLTILKDNGTCSIQELSKLTGFSKTDIMETLSSLGLIKYWRGENIVCVTPKQVEDMLRTIEPKRRQQIEINEKCLVWTPPSSSATSTRGGAKANSKKP